MLGLDVVGCMGIGIYGKAKRDTARAGKGRSKHHDVMTASTRVHGVFRSFFLSNSSDEYLIPVKLLLRAQLPSAYRLV